jgi:hypothetical protein
VPTCIPKDNTDFYHIFYASNEKDTSKDFKVTGGALDYLHTLSEVGLEFVL